MAVYGFGLTIGVWDKSHALDCLPLAVRRPVAEQGFLEDFLGLFRCLSTAPVDLRFAVAGRFHRPASSLCGAEGYLRIFPRARRPLRQGAVPRGRVPRCGRSVAL